MKDITSEDFDTGIRQLLEKLAVIENKIDRLYKQQSCLDGETLLDNQDLCQLLKISDRTLQRYRTKGLLPYYTIDGKVYYKSGDINTYIRKHAK